MLAETLSGTKKSEIVSNELKAGSAGSVRKRELVFVCIFSITKSECMYRGNNLVHN